MRRELSSEPALCQALFDGSETWSNLLSYKLVPHLAGEGCLIVAVAGGTNTGKTTVFNLLLGRTISPVRATAAATRRPVIACSPMRAAQCLERKLVPEFAPHALHAADEPLRRDAPPDALYVVAAPELPDRLALLDTPDIDSIERENWAVAEQIRAAGDVLIAVLTGEKYRDERVVAFFRLAHASGRTVLSLMNKADPREHFAVARKQLEEFRADVGIEGPCFALPHDFSLADAPHGVVQRLDAPGDLWAHIHALDAPAIKRRVYQSTVGHFAHASGEFLDRVEAMGARFESIIAEFDERARRYAHEFEPAPGAEVGGLFHEYVQNKRGSVRRVIGAASRGVVRGVTAVGRSLSRSLYRRTQLEGAETPRGDAELHKAQVIDIERLARSLATSYIESAHNIQEPGGHLVQEGLAGLDVNAAILAVRQQALRSEHLSEAFREHARRMLDAWWDDHRGRRRVVEALDAILAVAPAAIALPIAIYTGPGLPETTLAIAGPVVEQFAARVFEYQFGDAMFDFLSPWRTEQQALLCQALRAHITAPALAHLHQYAAVLQGETFTELRILQRQLLTPQV